MELISVAAVADNGVIGRDGGLPWPSIPADRARYRARVADDPVVLGRRTFEAMREDPPGSEQLVLSRSPRSYGVPTAHPVQGVEEALAVLPDLGAGRAYVLGGAAIYEAFQPRLDRMVLSRIPGAYEGDARYPEWSPDGWRLLASTEYETYTLEEWIRAD